MKEGPTLHNGTLLDTPRSGLRAVELDDLSAGYLMELMRSLFVGPVHLLEGSNRDQAVSSTDVHKYYIGDETYWLRPGKHEYDPATGVALVRCAVTIGSSPANVLGERHEFLAALVCPLERVGTEAAATVRDAVKLFIFEEALADPSEEGVDVELQRIDLSSSKFDYHFANETW